MKKEFIIAVVIIGLNIGSTSFAGNLNVGDYEQEKSQLLERFLFQFIS